MNTIININKIKRIFGFGPALHASNRKDIISIWRERIFLIIFISTSAIGIFIYVISVADTIQKGWWVHFAVYTLGYLVILCTLIFRRIPFNIRAWAGSLLFFSFGVLTLMSFGMIGSGRVYLFAFSIVATLLLKMKGGVIALILNITAMITVGWLAGAGLLGALVKIPYTTELWFYYTATFIWLNTIITISLAMLVQVLEESLTKEIKFVGELDAVNIELKKDIDTRKKIENALQESEEQFRILMEQSPIAIQIMNPDGRIVQVNNAYEKLWGITLEDLNEYNILQDRQIREIGILPYIEKAFEGETATLPEFEYNVRKTAQKGRKLWIRSYIYPVKGENGEIRNVVMMDEDITERKQAERNQNIMAEILGILNEPIALTDALSSIITIIKREMGFDAVGIRLQNGDDFPYFSQDGFSDDFLITENMLVVQDPDGGLCRDENGKVSLGCTCGMVISGQTDPNDLHFTPGGSWWTNNSAPLLDIPDARDPGLHPRNRCIHDGYLSVALIPIRANSKIVGLLQFNDRKKDCFTPEMILFFEDVSTSIGIALMRKQVVNMLKKHAHELELNKNRLDASLQLTHMTDSSLENIARFVLDEGAKLTNSKFGFISLINEDESVLTTYAWSKYVMDTCGLDARSPMFYVKGGGLWTEPLLQRKSVIVNDYDSCELNKNGTPDGHIPIERLINVPIFEGDRIVAIAALANKDEEYDETDVRQLTLLLDGMWTILKRKEAEEKYRTLFNSSSDAIMLLDKDGFFDCNQATLNIFGYDNTDEFIGLHPADVSPQFQLDSTDSVTAANSRIKEAYEKGHANFEWIHTRKDGSDFQTEVTLTAFVYGGRKVLQATVRDITERKQAEESLQKYSEGLEHSNELKELFTDIMRHDLLNPASVIKGYTEMLIDMEDNEKKIAFLQKIGKNNKKLIDMIETTARFAKLESVEEFEFGEGDISAIFKTVVDNFRLQIENKHITLEFKAKGIYSANINSVIEEVFANLLSNAIKYSPPESKIIVDIIDAGENWKVTVTDFGEGVPDEHKTLLFDRFQRVNKIAVKGSGLGLAIVKRIIELHGGEVGIEDNPAGVGSVFWVTVKKA